jgi:hypothetical protein
VAKANGTLDRYTRQLHQLGLESSEREVRWLNEVIAAEQAAPNPAPSHTAPNRTVKTEGEPDHG